MPLSANRDRSFMLGRVSLQVLRNHVMSATAVEEQIRRASVKGEGTKP